MATPKRAKKKRFPTKPEEVGRLARKAADVINDRGWTKGTREQHDGSVCAIGALSIAFNGNPNSLRNESSTVLGDWFKTHYPKVLWPGLLSNDPGNHHIEWYNDSLFESKEEAVTWLRKAADDLDPRGANKLH
jgi:hypothetical protein